MIQIEASPEEIYDIELEHSLLEANAKLANDNRAMLDRHGITAIDFMGAIGSGKTTLITRLVEKLKDRIGVAVFNGDATTSTDADPIAAHGRADCPDRHDQRLPSRRQRRGQGLREDRSRTRSA